MLGINAEVFRTYCINIYILKAKYGIIVKAISAYLASKCLESEG